ncbi:MAG: thioredoxin domain-containing protein [Hydrococcus sp. Prado102]|jgi:thioredoxin-like negative regulator of GroEL|nr:thioredoxin domain-containing protein [Hydrococcus sp. Prado102]
MQETYYLNETFYVGKAAWQILMQSSDKLIIVKFVAPHCGSCITLKPVLEELVREYGDRLHLVEIDLVEETKMAIALGIRNAPTVVLFKQQQEIARIAGLKPKKQYLEMLQQAL